MEGYLGEFPVEAKNTDFKHFTPADWALYYIALYGQIDGGHHKQWVLDQVARILNGTKVKIKIAKWKNPDGSIVHSEYRVSTGRPSKQYNDWVLQYKGEKVDGEYEYGYDEGIAP